MSYQRDTKQRVHFLTVIEPADYRGNKMPHTYLVVDGLRIAATKAHEPSARLMEMYQREVRRIKTEATK